MLDGRLLNERYQVMQRIGGGGMANVYLAHDTILNREVAIKVLRLEYANDEEFIARFHREAHSATSLSHPNIVNIYDVGEEDGIYYMVMEHVDGMTLKEYVQTYGPLPVEEALDAMRQVTSAICHAHENGIIHRDIKPQNILLDAHRQIKVTDFGIAMALSATSLTQTNSVLGSVHYLSPEQARGGVATKKSDIYSLGIVMYELLTGQLPFSGESAVSIAIKHLQSETPSVRAKKSDVPQSVENIVLKSTTKNPYYRYDTVYEMEDDLESALLFSRRDEEKFVVPEEAGATTKAIPVLKEGNFEEKSIEDTIVHSSTYPVHLEEERERDVEKKKTNKVKKKKSPLFWVFLIGFIMLALGTSTAFALPYLLQPKDVEVINVAGMEYEQALVQLNEMNLKVERETMFSDEVPEGNVIRSDPEAGAIIKEEQTVTLYTSKGKERVKFSDYVGEEFSQIQRLLEERGYKEVIAYEKYSDRPVGEIISQIQPQPDSQVIPEETNVIFEISRGPELVTLVSLEGMSESKAKEYLNGQNLQVSVAKENSAQIEEGNVIRQNPEPFTQVEKNSTIELVVSAGPEELPPITHSVTFTVPYTGEVPQENEAGQQQEDVGQKPEEDEEESQGAEEEQVQQTEQENQENQGEKQDEPEKTEPQGQTVKIYVEDANRNISDVFKEEVITEDKEYTIRLTILPEKTATYKVVRNKDIVFERTIPYNQGGEDE